MAGLKVLGGVALLAALVVFVTGGAALASSGGTCSDMNFAPLGKCGAALHGPGTLSTHSCFGGKSFCTAPFKLSVAVPGYGTCDARAGHQTESGKCLSVDQVTFKGGVGLAVQTPDASRWCTDVDPCASSESQAYTLAWPVAGNKAQFAVTISVVGFGWVASHIGWTKEIHFGADTQIPVTPSGSRPPSSKTSLTVAISSSTGSKALAVGAETDETVKVTAVGGAVSAISLGKGLTVSSGAAKITKSPSGLSGFSLAKGASRSFVFTVKGASTGAVSLNAGATGRSSAGKAVRGSDTLGLRVGGSPLVALVEVTPGNVKLTTVPETVNKPGGAPVTVTVRVKNVSAGAVQHVHVDPRLIIGYDDGDPAVPVVPLRQDGTPSPPGDLGSLAPGATSKVVTFKLLAKGDGGYSIEALASADTPGAGIVHGVGKTSVKITSPYLSFATKLGENTNGNGTLWGAGVPYTVRLTVQNLSYRKSVALVPSLTYQGNAQGGGMLALSSSIPGQESAQACAPGEAIQLRPREEKEYKIVVYTSKVGAAVLGGTGGGTRSVVVVNLPGAGVVNEAGDGIASKLTAAQIEMSGNRRYETSLSDPGIIKYPETAYTPVQAYLYWSLGQLEGIGAFEYGLAHGLLVDLPTLAGKGLKAMPSALMRLVQFEAEIWQAAKNDPALVAKTLVSPAITLIEAASANAPALAATFKKISASVNDQIYNHFSKISNDWFAGDWRRAATAAGSSYSETGLNIATLIPSVGSCLLARAAPLLTTLNEAKAALFAEATAKIGSLDALVPAGVALTKISDLVPGMRLNYEELLKLYGLTKDQVDFLRQFARDNKLLITVRSRATQSVKWLEEFGAVLKPEQIKIKSVSWLDTEVLGYRLSDLGRVVLRKPISAAELRANLSAKGIASTVLDASGKEVTNPVWQDSFKLLNQRVSEFTHARGGFVKGSGGYYRDLEDAAKEGKIKLRWNLADNSIDPTIAENSYTTYKFRLFDEGGGNLVPEFFADGKWRCVTGDVDFLSMARADSSPIDAATRVKLYTELAGGNPIHMLHPAADTWTAADGSFWFAAKQNEFKRAGVVPEFAPDGIIRAVEFDPTLSWFDSVNDYRPVFDGGYVGPPLTPALPPGR